MIILGIETSCDETAASVIQDGRKILSHVIATSQDMHAKTGGIIPENAAREQVKSIIPVIEQALIGAKLWEISSEKGISNRGKYKNTHNPPTQLNTLPTTHNIPPIDAIAVTVGPGLIGSLLVGVETAKTLSALWNKPIVPINHLVAHIYANWLNPQLSVLGSRSSVTSLPVVSQPDKPKTEKPESENRKQKTDNRDPLLPAIALVVSGGHTDLVLLKKHGDIEKIGGTRDDAAGEAFDKTARLLGLPYPGGPSIGLAASKFEMTNSLPADATHQALQAGKLQMKLPRSLIDEDNFDFSFSGLKTQVAREVAKVELVEKVVNEMAWEIQEAITDVLVEKSLKAVKQFGVKTFLLAGGVASNARLKEKFKEKILNLNLHLNFCAPPPWLCTDNASYIAACAEFNYNPKLWSEIEANPSLTIMQ